VRQSYRVDAERRGDWWTLTSPDAPGAVSQVRRLSQADEHAREAIAFVLDIDPDSFDLHIVPRLTPALADQLAAARSATEEAADAARRAADQQRKIIQELAMTQGLNGREIAALLGVSPQRVSQMVAERNALVHRKHPPATTTRRDKTAAAAKASPKRVAARKSR
jgi:hypothetical protein